MILLDTCVIAEALRPDRDQALISWLDNQSAETLFIAATSVTDLLIGVAEMSNGKRKKQVGSALEMLLTRLFSSRILSFDQHAAVSCSELLSNARKIGISLSMSDGQLAALALVHGFAIATCHTRLFEPLGLKTVNPWTSAI
ncbi:MAG TPA: PIN domain-containing protein [Drouetiella sp.]|jgi:toxin FitB